MTNPIAMQLDPKVVAILSQITTATITTILLKKGLRNVWLRGTYRSRAAQPNIAQPFFEQNGGDRGGGDLAQYGDHFWVELHGDRVGHGCPSLVNCLDGY